MSIGRTAAVSRSPNWTRSRSPDAWPRLSHSADRLPDQRLGRVAEHALDGLALILDGAVRGDHGHDVRGVLDERFEPLLARMQVLEARVEVARQRDVLQQRDDLAGDE